MQGFVDSVSGTLERPADSGAVNAELFSDLSVIQILIVIKINHFTLPGCEILCNDFCKGFFCRFYLFPVRGRDPGGSPDLIQADMPGCVSVS